MWPTAKQGSVTWGLVKSAESQGPQARPTGPESAFKPDTLDQSYEL